MSQLPSCDRMQSAPPQRSGSDSGSQLNLARANTWVSQRPVDVSQSLYFRCLHAMDVLKAQPDLEPYFSLLETQRTGSPEFLAVDFGISPPGRHLDSVSMISRFLRLGGPMCLLFNKLGRVQLEVLPPGDCTNIKFVKRSLYRFLEACMTELRMNAEEDLFTISNVFSLSTTDLAKALRTLQLIIDRLADQNLLEKHVPSASLPEPRDQRDRVMNELVYTEQKYVQNLEILLIYHDALLQANFPRDTVSKMFPYIPKIVDFQRRFLAGLEYECCLEPTQQNLAWIFERWVPDFKQLYEGFTLNQKTAADLANQEIPNLIQFSHILEPTWELQAMLLTPVQRICRYPLLLKQLEKHTPTDWPYYQDLCDTLAVMQGMMIAVNETQRKVENRFVRRDLEERIKDWKGLDISSMGELLLSGAFPVLSLGEESEYNLYLFEKMLLCCKDRVLAKRTPLGKIRPSRASHGKGTTLELKGRIYLSYVSSVRVTRLPNGYLLSLGWGQDDASEIGAFEVRLANDEQAAFWEATISRLANRSRDLPNGNIPLGFDDDDTDSGAKFWEDAGNSPVEALRKLSVSSESNRSRWSLDTSGGARSSRVSESVTPIAGSQSHLPSLRSRTPSYSTETLELNGRRRVRVYVQTDTFLLLVPDDVTYSALAARVERKLRLCGKPVTSSLSLRYLDEDGDYVRLASDDDLAIALEAVPESEELTLHIG